MESTSIALGINWSGSPVATARSSFPCTPSVPGSPGQRFVCLAGQKYGPQRPSDLGWTSTHFQEANGGTMLKRPRLAESGCGIVSSTATVAASSASVALFQPYLQWASVTPHAAGLENVAICGQLRHFQTAASVANRCYGFKYEDQAAGHGQPRLILSSAESQSAFPQGLQTSRAPSCCADIEQLLGRHHLSGRSSASLQEQPCNPVRLQHLVDSLLVVEQERIHQQQQLVQQQYHDGHELLLLQQHQRQQLLVQLHHQQQQHLILLRQQPSCSGRSTWVPGANILNGVPLRRDQHSCVQAPARPVPSQVLCNGAAPAPPHALPTAALSGVHAPPAAAHTAAAAVKGQLLVQAASHRHSKRGPAMQPALLVCPDPVPPAVTLPGKFMAAPLVHDRHAPAPVTMSPMSCLAPTTPPLDGDTPRECILFLCKALSMSESTTARLALHIWHRIHGMVRLLVSVRPPAHVRSPAAIRAAAANAERIYSVAALWLAAKLEERRREVPGVATLCVAAQTVPAVLVAAELRVMQWCEWAPYAGFVPDDSHLLIDL